MEEMDEVDEVEVEYSEGEGAELLMECDEEEQEVWPQSYYRGEEEVLMAAISSDEEEEEDEEQDKVEVEGCELPRVRIIPLPEVPQHLTSNIRPSSNTSTMKCSGPPLGFTVNGRLVPQQPGGGSTELQIHSHPPGSSSGFTSVQIPITVTVQSPAGTRHINTTASVSSTVLPISADHTPIITGVVSGEAAQKVLSAHRVNFTNHNPQPMSSPPPIGPNSPPPASLTSPQATPPPLKKRKKLPIKKGAKQLRKGELGPVFPPDCPVCRSHYKLISELRGFMCLCSPIIAQSLKTLKKKPKQKRRSKDKHKFSKGSKAHPSIFANKVMSPVQKPCRPSDDFLPDQFTSSITTLTSTPIPQRDQSVSASENPQGKLVIMVDDFYYGSAPGHSTTKINLVGRKFAGPYRCIHCPLTLHNNIKLMSHLKQHMDMMSQESGGRDSSSYCPHCFRYFSSPLRLQGHMEAVHSQRKSTTKCLICELEFGNEATFLMHMKNMHKPGEMPYICQVCEFRSSSYSDVWSHFEEAHADTKHLMCQYCLRVQCSSTYYQQHFARHLKNQGFDCEKCRLQFLYVKERIEHKMLHHKTHIKPLQLRGLKPGTKVTVRTYSMVPQLDGEEQSMVAVVPCKVVDVNPAPSTQEAVKRKPAESLGLRLSNLSHNRSPSTASRNNLALVTTREIEAVQVSCPSRLCIECMVTVQDFSSHFPSMVKCSLCRFVTCCSTSYANHMINNHSLCRKSPLYQSIFTSGPRLDHRLTCVSCLFSTTSGDVMANHLIERPQHQCVMPTQRREAVKRRRKIHTCDRQNGGSFVPIEKLQSSQTSAQVSVQPLTRLSRLCSEPAMTIRILGPRKQSRKSTRRLRPPPSSPRILSADQLSAVLFSLCNGLSQAARRFNMPPAQIDAWTRQQERQLADKIWKWKTSHVAKWVLTQREQQRGLNEETLLASAKRALGDSSPQISLYQWAIDFMLRHDLSVQITNGKDRRRRQPKDLADLCRSIIISVCTQVKTKCLPPRSFGCMDELTIFVDSDSLSSQDPEGLRMTGSAEETPLFDILLSALSDGTLLSPLLFYRGSPVDIPEGFPQNVLVTARKEGFPDPDRLRTWINKVWRPNVTSPPHSESLLLLDVHRGHLTDGIKNSLKTVHTQPIFIPAGCCCRLQPLDICVTPVLKEFLQARWTQLLSGGGVDGLSLDQFALTLACWLSEVCSMLNAQKDILRRSFLSVCSLQQSGNEEVERLIKGLTEALIQPLEVSESPPPQEQLQIFFVVEGKQKNHELMENEENEEKEEEEEEEEELTPGSPSALRQVFEGDSDQESFLGFEDTEIDE